MPDPDFERRRPGRSLYSSIPGGRPWNQLDPPGPGLLAPARPGETNAIATAPSARKSAKGREHLLVRREPAGRLLGIREPAVHGNLEHTTAGPMQLHLRAGCRLLNQTCRRTGARFIASHSAVFDLNLHRLLSGLSSRLLKQQQPALHVATRRHRRKPSGLHYDAHRADQNISRQTSRRDIVTPHAAVPGIARDARSCAR
jgi:hypothetical protein